MATIAAAAVCCAATATLLAISSDPATAQSGSSLPVVAIADPTFHLNFAGLAPAVTEGATLTWTLTRTGSTANELTVPLRWFDRGGGDYESFFDFSDENPKIEAATFPVGASEITLSVDTEDDTSWEYYTRLVVCVSNLSDDGEGVHYVAENWLQCAAFEIQDNDTPPLVTITAQQESVEEGVTARFTVTRLTDDLTPRIHVRFDFQRVKGSNVTKFRRSQSLEIESGMRSSTLFVGSPENDSPSDADDYVIRVTIADPLTVTLTGAPNGTYTVADDTRSAEVAVKDDDLPLVHAVAVATDKTVANEVSQTEADSVRFRISRLGPVDEPLTVSIRWTGTDDYLPDDVPATLTFQSGEAEKELSFAVDNGVDQVDGAVVLSLSSTSEYAVTTDAQHVTVTIADDDEPQHVTIARDSESVDEGGNVTFTLSRGTPEGTQLISTGPTFKWPLTVNVSVIQQGDFISGTPTTIVTIPANATTAMLVVPTVDDRRPRPLTRAYDRATRFHSAYEDDGSVTATVRTGENYTPGLPDPEVGQPALLDDMTSATTTVSDNEPPLVRASVAGVPADNLPTTTISTDENSQINIEVSRYSFDSSLPLSVRLMISNINCYDPENLNVVPRQYLQEEIPFTAGFDHTYTVTIPAGQASQTYALTTTGDDIFECDIRFDVKVLSPEGSVASNYDSWTYHPLYPDRATVYVRDEDERPVIKFSSSEVDEDDVNAEIQATLHIEARISGYRSRWPYTLHWWTIPQTATETRDYTKQEAQTAIFAAQPGVGNDSVTLSIPIVDNFTPEGTETFTIGYRISSPYSDNVQLTRRGSQAVVTILDNDATPTVAVKPLTLVSENEGVVRIPVKLSQASDQVITVDWATEEGLAKSGQPPFDDDYASATGTVSFAPGTTNSEVVVTINDDRYAEPHENFTVRLSSPMNATLGHAAAIIFILNDEVARVAISGPTGGAAEDAGTATFTFSVVDYNGIPNLSARPITVTYSVHDGDNGNAELNAEHTSDFVPPSVQTVTIPAGTAGLNIEVQIVDDSVDEHNQSFYVTIDTVVNAFIHTKRSSLHIVDNDALPVISVHHTSSIEPADSDSSSVMTFEVVLGQASEKTVTTAYGTLDATARSTNRHILQHDRDYTAQGGSIVFQPGEVLRNIDIELLSDDFAEIEETFHLHLSRTVNAQLLVESGRGVIKDASRLPLLNVESFDTRQRQPEGNTFIILLELNHPDDVGLIVSGRETTVEYEVYEYVPTGADDAVRPATRTVDYLLDASGTITIGPGLTNASLRIPTVDDSRKEARSERFGLRFKNPTNAVLFGTSEAFLIIQDNDPRPLVRVDDARATESSGIIEFRILLSTVSNLDIAVDYYTEEVSAGPGDDYIATRGTATIVAGATETTVTVGIVDDSELEPIEEKFELVLSDPVNGQLAKPSRGVGFIIDDDRTLPPGTVAIVLHPDSVSVDEGSVSGSAIAVSLANKPAGTVQVTIEALNTTDLSASPASLTFTVNNWNQAQTVTVTASSDEDADDDVESIRFVAAGGGYSGVERSIVVTVQDDDVADIIVSTGILDVTENATGIYSVRLATLPLGPVRVTVTTSSADLGDESSVSIDPVSLEFTSTSWAMPQEVTVTANDDNDATDEVLTVLHSALGLGYDGLSKSVSIQVDDDDVPELVVKNSAAALLSGSPSLTIDERSSGYVTLELATEPTAAVTIELISGVSDAIEIDDDGSPRSKTLVFGRHNWFIPQRLEVQSLGDNNAVQEGAITVTMAATGGDYAGISIPDLSVTVTETDAVGLTFNKTHLRIDENSVAAASYSVRLSTQPLNSNSKVVVTLSTAADTAITFEPAILTFSYDNWSTIQYVDVFALHDEDSANAMGTLVHTASGADEYEGIISNLPLTIVDDDDPSLIIEPGTLIVQEGTTASYTVRLSTTPSDDVLVIIGPVVDTDFILDSVTLTFTVDNWQTPQTVRVSADHDDDATIDNVDLVHSASGGQFDGVTFILALSTSEDEVEALAVSAEELTITEGAEASITVALASRPSGSVTVGISYPSDADLTTDVDSLTFTVDNWQDTQTVVISTTTDNDAADDSVRVQLSITNPQIYDASAVGLGITIDDVDVPALVVAWSANHILEGSYTLATVRLATQPSAPVMMSSTITGSDDVVMVPSQWAFSLTNWSTVRVVTVYSEQDDNAVDETAGILLTALGGDYTGITSRRTLRVMDDDDNAFVFADTQGNLLSDDPLTVRENSDIQYAVRLDAQPTGDVTVTLTSNSSVTVSPAQVIFTAENWRMFQTLTITAANDEDSSDQVATIAHAGSGGGYSSVSGTVDVSVVDDDLPAILFLDQTLRVLPGSRLTVPEGESNTYRLRLSTKPSAAVTITVSGFSASDLSLDKTELIFTSINWHEAQTVVASAAHDDDAGADQSIDLRHSASGVEYAAVSGLLQVDIAEDDTESLVLADTDADAVVNNRLFVPENGSASYDVRLSAKPSTNVSIRVSGASGTDLTIDRSQLEFTPTDWNVTQSVTVTAADDVDAVDDRVTLHHAIQGFATGSASFDLPVTIVDDDLPGIVLGGTDFEITEGLFANWGISLASRPTDTVVVRVTLPIGSDLESQTENIMYEPDEWQVVKTFRFMSREDDDAVNDEEDIDIRADGGDYRSVVETFPATILDNDTPAIVLDMVSLTIAEGVRGTFTVQLATQPSETVTITIDGSVGTDLTLDLTVLAFTRTNWNTAQTITVSAAQDAGSDDETVSLDLTAVGGDYDTVSTDLLVAIVDDDLPDVEASFGSGSYTVSEGATVTVTVLLSALPEREVVVPLSADGLGGADAGDFSGVPSSVTFAADETSRQFAFAATADSVDDDDESVRLSFGALPPGVTAASPQQAVVAIVDDDLPDVEASFGSGSYTVSEGATVTVTVLLSALPEREVVVPLSADGLGGAAAGDFSGVPSSVTFAADETSRQFAFEATADSVDDDDESVRLSFGALPPGVTAASPQQAVVAIVDDDLPDVEASFGSGSYTVSEGATVTVTVLLSALPEREVVVPLSADGLGGADAGDFSGVPSSVTFAADETSRQFAFEATADSVDDDDESVRLSFGALPPGVTAASPQQAVVAIVDDDLPDVEASFGSGSYTVSEGATVTVTVLLSALPEREVVVPLSADGLGGAAAGDFSGVPSSVTFAADETSRQFAFEATADSVDDDDESVRLSFGALPPGVTAASPQQAVVAIVDDDLPDVEASFGSGSYTVSEGATVTVTVLLSALPEREVVVPLSADGLGGAAAGDFSGVPSSVTFAADETSRQFAFEATADSVDDDDESVRLSFGALPPGVTAASPQQAVVAIVDDDLPDVEASFGSGSYTVSEGATVTVTVLLSALPEREVVVPLSADGLGGAAAGDFSGVPSSVTFAADETSRQFAFEATADSVDDDDESVRLSFGALPPGVTAASPQQAVVAIVDDDLPDVEASFGSGSYTVSEGATVTVTVLLSALPEREVVVPLSADGLGGADAGDFSGVPSSVTFAADETSRQFAFAATADSVDDDDESVRLSFGALPPGVTAASPQQAVVAIVDDDLPDVEASFGSGSYTVSEGATVTVTVLLSALPEREVVVPLSADGLGGAAAGDFSGVPSSVTFAADETSRQFAFEATADSVDDDDESVRLSFGALPPGVTAASPQQAVVAIVDDDLPDVEASFGSGSYTVSEGATVTVTVLLSALPEREVVVPLSADGLGGAAAGDFSGVPSSVTFAADETSRQFAFAATADSVDDDDESVRLSFGALPPGVTAASPQQAVVAIVDDDLPDVEASFGSGSYTVSEGATVTVTVLLSALPEREVVVPLSADGLGGAAAGDFSGVPSSVTFAADETSRQFAFEATADSVDDDDESVRLSFGALPPGVTAASPQQAVVAIVDDDPVRDDPVPDDPVRDDPVPDDPVRDDPVPDDPVRDDPVPDDPVRDDILRRIDDLPPSDQCTAASAVEVGDVLRGSINAEGEAAWFAVRVEPYVLVSLWLRSVAGQRGSLPEPRIIQNRQVPEGLTQFVYAFRGRPFRDGSIWYPATSGIPTTLCFQVVSLTGGVGSFEVEVELNEDPRLAGAPNGYVSDAGANRRTARPVPTGYELPNGSYSPLLFRGLLGDHNMSGADEDWFRVKLEAGFKYRFSVGPEDQYGPRYRPDRLAVTGVFDDVGLIEGTSSVETEGIATVEFVPNGDGVYYVGISATGDQKYGLYVLTISRIRMPDS